MKKFYLETYGCKLNEADSEIIRGMLSDKYQEVLDENKADFIVLNTCGVIDKTEQKIINRTKYFQEKGLRVYWTGCLPVIAKNNIADKSFYFDEIFKKDKSSMCDLKKRKEGISAIVSISDGCLGNCSYCGSRLARKGLYSFSKENILKEVNEVLKDKKEILLTSQGLANYGLDRGKHELPDLINDILKIDKNFRLKLGMMNPRFVKNIIDELIELYKDERLYNFMHLPIQSGDNDLLKEMNRGYSREDVLNIVNKFRNLKNDTVFATDIIVGHPKETPQAFKNTLNLIKKIKPDVLHVFRYSKREGTKDALLKPLNTKIKKERSKELVDLFQKQNFDKNKKFLGKEFEVLVLNNRNLTRTNSGRAVIVKDGKIGEFKKIKIVDYSWNYLIGE